MINTEALTLVTFFFAFYYALYVLISKYGPTPMKQLNGDKIKMPKPDFDEHQLEVSCNNNIKNACVYCVLKV